MRQVVVLILFLTVEAVTVALEVDTSASWLPYGRNLKRENTVRLLKRLAAA